MSRFAIADVGNDGSNPTVTFKIQATRFTGLLLYTTNNTSAITASKVEIVGAGDQGDVGKLRLYPNDGSAGTFSIERVSNTINLTVENIRGWSAVIFLCTANISATTINWET